MEVGLVAPLPVVSAPDTRSESAVRVIGEGVAGQPVTFPADDPVEAAESCARALQPLSDLPPRSLLDRLLDEAEALRGADAAAHDAACDLADAGTSRVAAAAHCPSEAASGRREGVRCEIERLRPGRPSTAPMRWWRWPRAICAATGRSVPRSRSCSRFRRAAPRRRTPIPSRSARWASRSCPARPRAG